MRRRFRREQIVSSGSGGGSSTSPLFADDFTTDLSDYTFLNGSSADLAVAGGVVTVSNAAVKELYPTSLAARKSFVAKAKIHPNVVNNGTWIGKFVDASNSIYAGYYNGAVSVYQNLGGARSFVNSSAISPGFSNTDYWLLVSYFMDIVTAMLFSADPETDTSGLVGLIQASLPSFDNHTVAGRPGLHLEPIGNNLGTVDDFKVWSAGAHPFDL